MAIDQQGIFMSHAHSNTIGLALLHKGRTVFFGTMLGLTWVVSAAQAGTIYFDGTTQRTVTLDPQWTAYFSTPDATGAVARSGTSPSSPAPFVTLHRSTDPQARATMGRASPVFREGDSPAGRLMALPGGVLVQFKPDWSDDQVRSWTNTKGLGLGQKLNIRGQWWIVTSEPGLASLELANTLHKAGDVVSATPNWWKQTVTR